MRRDSIINICRTLCTWSRDFRRVRVSALRAMQYTVHAGQHYWSNGECIEVDPKTGELEGGQDHRSHYGKAAGY